MLRQHKPSKKSRYSCSYTIIFIINIYPTESQLDFTDEWSTINDEIPVTRRVSYVIIVRRPQDGTFSTSVWLARSPRDIRDFRIAWGPQPISVLIQAAHTNPVVTISEFCKVENRGQGENVVN